MGWDIDRFPEGEVNLELICCICTCILEDPVESPCRHVFCSQCIKTWLSNQKSCPHCRAPVHKRDLQSVVPLLKNIISKQKIYCDNKERGCLEVVALENLQGHIASCAYGLVACSYEGCLMKVLRKDHKVHSEVCAKRTVMCEQGCEMFLTLGERTSHNCIRSLKAHFQEVTNELMSRISKLEELVNDLVSRNDANNPTAGNGNNTNHRNNHRTGGGGGGRSGNHHHHHHHHRGGGGNDDCVSYNIPSPGSYDSDPPPYTVISNNTINITDVNNYDDDRNDNNNFSDSLESVESDSAMNDNFMNNVDQQGNIAQNRRRSASTERGMSPVYDHLNRANNAYGSDHEHRRDNQYLQRQPRRRSRSPHVRNVANREPLDTTYTEGQSPAQRRNRFNHHSNNNNHRNNRLHNNGRFDLLPDVVGEQDNEPVVVRVGVSETVSDSSSSSSSSTDTDTD